ncbi:hypothetical protein Tco_1292906 [Tanacetum coccineum]
MREFAANDQEDCYLGITSIMVYEKNAYELKGKFLDDLHMNAFNETHREDAVEHIKYFLKIVDSIDLPNVDLTAKFFGKYYPPSRTGKVNTPIIKWDPTNPKFENWLASKLVYYKTMDIFTKGALWDYWKMGSDEIEPTNEETSNLEETYNTLIPSEDPYEGAAIQFLFLLEQQPPRSPEYVPNPIELEDHVPVYIPEPEHPEDLVPAEDEAPIEAYITEIAYAPPPPPSFLPSLIRPTHGTPHVTIYHHMYHPLGHKLIYQSDTPPPERSTTYCRPQTWCEVGESSVTAGARQPGPTMARRVDCSSVDTMETRVQDTWRRMMAALEVVNLRVSYQKDHAARAEIEILRRERLAYEQERIETR